MNRIEGLEKELQLAEKLLQIYTKIAELQESTKVRKHSKVGWPPYSPGPPDWNNVTFK